MNITEFQEMSKATAIYPNQGTVVGSMYCTLGLVGELAELEHALNALDLGELAGDNVIKESGDVMWYLSQLATEFDITLEEHSPASSPPQTAVTSALGNICELVKKYFRDGGEDYDMNALSSALEYNIKGIIHVVQDMLYSNDIDLSVVMQTNIDKLQSRMSRGKLGGSGDNR